MFIFSQDFYKNNQPVFNEIKLSLKVFTWAMIRCEVNRDEWIMFHLASRNLVTMFNGWWFQTDVLIQHRIRNTVEVLESGHPRDAKKVSVTEAGHSRECKNAELVWEFRKKKVLWALELSACESVCLEISTSTVLCCDDRCQKYSIQVISSVITLFDNRVCVCSWHSP